jgi:outer membrane protein
MKNLQAILIGLLILAVGFLFVKQSKSAPGTTPGENKPKKETSTAPKIVFVKGDTLLDKYDVFQTQIKALEAKGKRMEANLSARGQALQREFLTAQQKAQSGTWAPAQIQQEEQRLVQKQQALAQDQERMGRQIQEERLKIEQELEKKIKSLLEDIRKEKGYDYILNYGQATGVLMADSTLDITPEVLKRLNTKPATEKKE